MKEEIVDSTITISKADKRHSKGIVDLLLSAWLYTYPNEHYKITEAIIIKKFGDVDQKVISITKFLDSIRNTSEVTYIVAEVDRKISGFLYSTKSTDNLYINALYVHPDYHRIGVGSTLLREGIMLNQGIRLATVDVILYNEQALEFYSKHNFIIQGLSKTSFGLFPDGITVPEIQLIKDCTNIEINNSM